MTDIRDEIYNEIKKSSDNVFMLSPIYKLYAVYDSKEDLIKIYRKEVYSAINLDLVYRDILLAILDNDNILTCALKYISSLIYCDYIPKILQAISKRYTNLYYRSRGYDVFDDGIEYDVQLISNKPIHRVALNTEALPWLVDLQYIDSKFSLGGSEKSYIKYIDGNITCVTDPKALEEIEFILLFMAYCTSKTNNKYDLMMYSVNHKSRDLPKFRYRAVSFRIRKTKEREIKLPNEHPLNKYYYHCKQVSQTSKQIVELERLIDQWLDRNKLYTEEKNKYSFYVVDLKSLDPLTVTKALANKELREIYNI